MDDKGRILIPSKERSRLNLKPGAEFELIEKEGEIILKPIIPAPIRVKSKKKKWQEETFLDAGEATFCD